MNCKSHSIGFSMVELLVALFVFTLMTTFAYRAVDLLGDAEQGQALAQNELTALQRGLVFFTGDTTGGDIQYLDDSANEEADGDILTLSTINSSGGAEQIRYSLQDGTVLRRQLQEGGEEVESAQLQLLQDIRTATASLYTGTPAYPGKDGDGAENRVLGMQFEMSHGSLGKVVRYVHLAKGTFDKTLNTLDDESGGGTSAGGSSAGGGGSGTNNTSGGDGNEGTSAGESTDSDSSDGANSDNGGSSPPPSDPLGGSAPW